MILLVNMPWLGYQIYRSKYLPTVLLLRQGPMIGGWSHIERAGGRRFFFGKIPNI